MSEKKDFTRFPPKYPIKIERVDERTLKLQNKVVYKAPAISREYLACSDGVILRLGMELDPPLDPCEYFNLIKVSSSGEFLWRLNPKNHGPKDYFVGLRHDHSEENFSANSGFGFYLEARYSDGEVVLREFVG